MHHKGLALALRRLQGSTVICGSPPDGSVLRRGRWELEVLVAKASLAICRGSIADLGSCNAKELKVEEEGPVVTSLAMVFVVSLIEARGSS